MPRNPGGRPPIGPQKSVRLNKADWDRIAEIGAANGVGATVQIRLIVEDYLSKLDGLIAAADALDETNGVARSD